MKDKILDGKKLADKLNTELKEKIKQVIKKTDIKPKLVTILVGKDSASKTYVNIFSIDYITKTIGILS